jgi:hypothetical protein
VNLIEAVKSGKRFRRKGSKYFLAEYCLFHENKCAISLYSSEFQAVMGLSWVDIDADDWEIEETSVPITRSQFFAAVNEASRAQVGQIYNCLYLDIDKLANKLADKLGLKP